MTSLNVNVVAVDLQGLKFVAIVVAVAVDFVVVGSAIAGFVVDFVVVWLGAGTPSPLSAIFI